MNVVYLLLGSNLGERRRYLESASARLVGELLPECMQGKRNEAVKCSSVYETEPWGFDSDDRFLNAVVRYALDVPCGTDMPRFAHDILDLCKSVEKEMGRTGGPEYDADGNRIYHSRIIDIDILFFGDLQMDDDDLKIPHPLMQKRDFVMVPLRQIYR